MRAKCCAQNILGRYQIHASHPRTPHTKKKIIIKLHTKEKKKENGIELIKLIQTLSILLLLTQDFII